MDFTREFLKGIDMDKALKVLDLDEEGHLVPKCRNVGRARFNPDGTENWCNRNGLDICGICDLHPNLD